MTSHQKRRSLLVGGALVVALAAGVGIGVAAADDDSGPVATVSAPGPVDIGFSQDMIVHHEQAVLMAKLVRDRTKDPRLAALAAGIEADQLLDIGAMRGYLKLWSAPVLPSGQPMAWMADDGGHHGDGAAAMPGMATVAELDELRRATGDKLDVMFLQLMLRHHAGGLGMLTEGGERASLPAVQGLANQMAYHQREETQTIVALLRARGVEPSSSG